MMREPAFAKVNLFLEVVGCLPNGYHHLQSLMVFADVGEWVSAAFAPAGTFTLSGPQAAQLPATRHDNLTLQAARAFNTALQLDQSYAIHLHKVMPVSSGIGGGSADAAAALRVLNQLHGMPLSQDDLQNIGAKLGADVPACLVSRPVLLDGPGAQLRSAEVRGCQHGVLVNPRQSVSTPAVFGALKAAPVDRIAPLPIGYWSLDDIMHRRNDLLAPARALCPQIADVLRNMQGLEGLQHGQMSGSGATCVFLFRAAQDADDALKYVRAHNQAWWSVRADFSEDPANLT